MSMPEEPTPWASIENYQELLYLLLDISGREALVVIDVYWRGCPACSFPPSAFGAALLDFADRHKHLDWVSTHSIHWRMHDNDNDLASPVSGQYKLLVELTAGERQYYGGGLPVENYTCNPPNWRVHFPQLFFLDGRKISRDTVQTLIDLDGADQLIHPDCNATLDHEGKAYCESTTGSGDLKLTNDAVRIALADALQHGAVLLQLVNEHLYRESGDQDADFMRSEFDESVDFVVEQYGHGPADPALCFRFDRRFK